MTLETDKFEHRWKIAIGVWVVVMGVLVIVSVLSGLSDDAKNDACNSVNGVYVKVYDGYKCYSNDFRAELVIE